MPKIIIDNREIEVPDGTKVIEAAERLGIMIPRFCYHPALGSVGACRVCAVKFQEGPVKGVQMSCMVAAKDGMVVSTTDEEAMDFRRHVVEWLMVNHPHDCPVCDEGGHCLLQDLTISGGHGVRRYEGLKRTYIDQDLGPLLHHEMNRCIHCYRCARFYKEFTGYLDLGVLGSANRTYFGRFREGILESPFSGNLADICPTGVFTDRPSRFKGRRWDYERRPSICIHCSLGCNTQVSARYREIIRQEARPSKAVNGHFICDRGRYGFYYADHATRPREATLGGKPVGWSRAVATAADKLKEAVKKYGSEAVALVASSRCSLETLAAAKRLCRDQGFGGPAYFLTRDQALKTKIAVTGCTVTTSISLGEIATADFILVAGADPVNEAPMLALAMRQAVRNGAGVAVMDPRHVMMPFQFDHLPVSGDVIHAYLKAISTGSDLKNTDSPLPPWVRSVSGKLWASRRPVIVCGTDVVPPGVPEVASTLGPLLKSQDRHPGLFFLLSGANAFGTALLSTSPEDNLETVIEGIESGNIHALALLETSPFREFPDRERLDRALSQLDCLVVLDYIDSEAVKAADVFLPTSPILESGGLFVNQEGRLQWAHPVYRGGLPIAQTGHGSHPPRKYDAGLPGAFSRPAWKAVAELGAVLSGTQENVDREALMEWLKKESSSFSVLPDEGDIPDDGIRLDVPEEIVSASSSGDASVKNEQNEKGLEFLLSDLTFGTETLSSFSECLYGLETDPFMVLSSSDAEEMGLKNGDRVRLQMKSLSFDGVEVTLRTAENAARGVCILPRHRRIPWQNVGSSRLWIKKEDIKKVSLQPSP